MGKYRRNFVASEILCYILDRNQQAAKNISVFARKIAKDSGRITEDQIREFLDPWVKNVQLKIRRAR